MLAPRRSKRLKVEVIPPDNAANSGHEVASRSLQTTVTLESIPPDVLLEICPWLNPIDMLALARSSRSLRHILLDRSSRQTWIQAFSHIPGLPPCPEDLNEPQYANLMFSLHCHSCLKDVSGTVTNFLLYMSRKRLCMECAPQRFMTWGNLPIKLPQELKSVIPYTTVDFVAWSTIRHGYQKYDFETAQALLKSYNQLSKEERVEWLKSRKADLEKRRLHGKACAEYKRKELEQRRLSLLSLREERLAEVRRHMTERAGFEEEFMFLDNLPPYLAITPSDWQRTSSVTQWIHDGSAFKLPQVEAALTPWFRHVRELRLYHEKVTLVKRRIKERVEPIYAEFISSQEGRDLAFPSILEVCFIDGFRDVLENTPAEADLSEEILEPGKAMLSTFVSEWRKDREEELLKIIRSSRSYSDGAEVTRDTLRLASTAFRCERCSDVVQYPGVLVHGCLLRPSQVMKLPRPDLNSSRKDSVFKSSLSNDILNVVPAVKRLKQRNEVLQHACRSTLVWTPAQNLTFHDTGFFHMKALLLLCELPLTITWEELEVVDPYVQTQCACFLPGVIIRFTNAILLPNARIGHKFPVVPGKIFILPPEDKQAELLVHREERLANGPDGQWGDISVHCVLCNVVVRKPQLVDRMKTHAQQCHGMSGEQAAAYVRAMIIDKLPVPWTL